MYRSMLIGYLHLIYSRIYAQCIHGCNDSFTATNFPTDYLTSQENEGMSTSVIAVELVGRIVSFRAITAVVYIEFCESSKIIDIQHQTLTFCLVAQNHSIHMDSNFHSLELGHVQKVVFADLAKTFKAKLTQVPDDREER